MLLIHPEWRVSRFGYTLWLERQLAYEALLSCTNAAKNAQRLKICTSSNIINFLPVLPFCTKFRAQVHYCLYAGICGNVTLQVRAQEAAAFLYYVHNTASLPIEGGVDLFFKGEGKTGKCGLKSVHAWAKLTLPEVRLSSRLERRQSDCNQRHQL